MMCPPATNRKIIIMLSIGTRTGDDRDERGTRTCHDHHSRHTRAGRMPDNVQGLPGAHGTGPHPETGGCREKRARQGCQRAQRMYASM